jgi:hypothetical protein
MLERFLDAARQLAKRISAALLIAIFCGLGIQSAFAVDRGETVGGESTGPSKSPAELNVPTDWTPQVINTLIRMYNPRYSSNGQFRIQDNRVTAAQLSETGVSDLTPLGGMSLEALDLRGLPVSDLSPLKGQPVKELYLEDTLVADLKPLKGKPLVSLYLNHAPVTDLSPLRGMPLETLNLLGTRIQSVAPLTGMPLKFLWLNETAVADISPLSDCPLVSLTLHRTQVSDLGPLEGSHLQRLHIGETPVRDLSPLKGLHLTRLIFTPARITKGLEVARGMASIREIGPSFEQKMNPAIFWERYDRGDFR